MNENQQELKWPHWWATLVKSQIIEQSNRSYKISKIKITKRGHRKHKNRTLMKRNRHLKSLRTSKNKKTRLMQIKIINYIAE